MLLIGGVDLEVDYADFYQSWVWRLHDNFWGLEGNLKKVIFIFQKLLAITR